MRRLAPEDTRRLLYRLWREHIRPERRLFAPVLVLTLLMAGTTALYPVVIDHAFTMFARKDPRILYQVPVLVVIITALKAAAQYGQTVLVQKLVLRIIRSLQKRMFGHLVRADLAQIEREAPAQLATRFTTDAAVMREALSRTLNGISDFFTLLGLIASMLWLDWMLTLIVAVLYPLAGLPIARLGQRIRRASNGMQERTGEAAAMLNESFAQARTVRAYRLEDEETARAGTAFDQLYKAFYRMTKVRARVEPVLEVLGGTAVALVIGFAGWRAAVGGHTIGNFTGFVAALLIASRPLRALGSLNAAMQEGLAGLVRVFGIIDERPTIVDRADAISLPIGGGRIEFDRATFVYADGRTGLDGLSFEAEPGLTVALVGPSGAGKSTAIALIPRLHDTTRGRVLIDGVDVRDLKLASLRDAIAYVGQDTRLFDDTIAANIRMGRPDASIAAIAAAAEAAAAADFIADLPQGYQTRVGPGGGRLSGGQRQRISVARALLRNPRILLLDEATSALDSESEAAIQKALARLRHGRTTIVIAHRLSTVRDADLVITMADGHAVEQGTHAELLAEDGVYARFVRTQALAQ